MLTTRDLGGGLTWRLLFAALSGSLAVSACSLQSPEPETHSNMLGLTEKQILSCLGAPAQKSTQGGADVWSYPDGQSCSVRISFLYGRASHVGYVGPNGQELGPGACPLVGEHCALR
ncbi:hypothetical protein [Methyloceanibacter sp.]|uniref:hypothetical protein n=1 Tax=Methyloceanibacter sp. TaxID=1965321 RepID=UPI002D38A8F0|nr:hypothetical protein [Methyloceanibacter sp.]HZP09474.1 hypothetical protein [Methyloceanibacter sp.]